MSLVGLPRRPLMTLPVNQNIPLSVERVRRQDAVNTIPSIDGSARREGGKIGFELRSRKIESDVDVSRKPERAFAPYFNGSGKDEKAVAGEDGGELT